MLLYINSDALLVFVDQTLTTMYKALSPDANGENSTMEQLQPGLIVNKPLGNWLCTQCRQYRLEHGFFNSGALLWHRDRAEPILRAWREARNTNHTHSFIDPKNRKLFPGWGLDDKARRLTIPMGEHNRLMYVYVTNLVVRDSIWPVTRQKYAVRNLTSCPKRED